tara:strand:+ start:193 stop:852 length:660 start_codon:yes stop_codon:yes gene_type:complete
MSINFEKARNLMVENQLRPNKINKPEILSLFKFTKKEDFLEDEVKDITYNDSDIVLEGNRGYLKNLHIAQLINKANIDKTHKVLHVGGMTGYVSTMLSKICKEIVVIENKQNLINQLEQNIKKLNINNIKVINSLFEDGFKENSPYDVIFIDSPIKKITKSIKEQLHPKNGTIIMIQKINQHLSKAYRIKKNNEDFSNEYLFDIFTKFELYKHEEGFIF